ncbi:unnamed protein product [Amoebophrya sp. A120]|nr:unnamed protein product [Amoebophrya sp. A120]|eukprot:GSA120T00004137001.1
MVLNEVKMIPQDPVEQWSRRRFIPNQPDESHAGLESFNDAAKSFNGLRTTRRGSGGGGMGDLQHGEWTDYMLQRDNVVEYDPFKEIPGFGKVVRQQQRTKNDASTGPERAHTREEVEERKGYESREVLNWGKDWTAINQSPERLPNYRRGAELPPWVPERQQSSDDIHAGEDAEYYRRMSKSKKHFTGTKSSNRSHPDKLFHHSRPSTEADECGLAMASRTKNNKKYNEQRSHFKFGSDGGGGEDASRGLLQLDLSKKQEAHHRVYNSDRVFDCLRDEERFLNVDNRRVRGEMHSEENWASSEIHPFMNKNSPKTREGSELGAIKPGGAPPGRGAGAPVSLSSGGRDPNFRRMFRKTDFYHGYS